MTWLFITTVFLSFCFPSTREMGGPSTEDLTMAVTIDDLPFQFQPNSAVDLQRQNQGLIDAFTSRRVPGIGFVNEGKLFRGKRLDTGRVGLLVDWLDAGLELGNHTFTHPDYHGLDFPAFREDILRGERITRPLAAERNLPYRFFRHPMLHTGNTPEKSRQLARFLLENGYIEAPVTIDNSEWIFARAYGNARLQENKTMLDSIARTYLDYMEAKTAWYERQSQRLFGRNITQVLLIHANSLNAEHLGALLDRLAGRGYVFVSLEAALQDPAYRSESTYTGPAGISWLDRWAITQGRKGDFFKGEPTCPVFIQDLAGIRE